VMRNAQLAIRRNRKRRRGYVMQRTVLDQWNIGLIHARP
jgi:hypothetical protein